MTTHLVNVYSDTPTSSKGTATCEYYEGSERIVWSQSGHQVPDGYAVFFRCQPNTGYEFDYWLLATTGAKIYTPSFDQTITGFFGATVFFKPTSPPPPPPPQYSNVTIAITGNGTTNPTVGNYPSIYELGSALYVTATPTPASGWQYKHMKRNGTIWTEANPGEFLNLAETENIEVDFEEGTIPPPPPPNGSVPTTNMIPLLLFGIFGLAGLGYYLWKRKK